MNSVYRKGFVLVISFLLLTSCISAKDRSNPIKELPHPDQLEQIDQTEQINETEQNDHTEPTELPEQTVTTPQVQATTRNIGNTCGNIVNGDRLAEDEEWLYSAREGGIYRLKKEDANSNWEKIIDERNPLALNVLDGFIYYSDFNSIKRANIDGKDIKTLRHYKTAYMYAVEDSIYFMSSQQDKTGLFKMKTDGTQLQHLQAGIYDKSLCISDDKIYLGEHGLTQMNLDGTGVVKLNNDKAKYINVVDDGIIYVSNNLIKVNKDGSNRTVLSFEQTSSIQVTEDWIYYSADDSYEFRRMKRDGSDKQSIAVNAVDKVNFVDGWLLFSEQLNPGSKEHLYQASLIERLVTSFQPAPPTYKATMTLPNGKNGVFPFLTPTALTVHVYFSKPVDKPDVIKAFMEKNPLLQQENVQFNWTTPANLVIGLTQLELGDYFLLFGHDRDRYGMSLQPDSESAWGDGTNRFTIMPQNQIVSFDPTTGLWSKEETSFPDGIYLFPYSVSPYDLTYFYKERIDIHPTKTNFFFAKLLGINQDWHQFDPMFLYNEDDVYPVWLAGNRLYISNSIYNNQGKRTLDLNQLKDIDRPVVGVQPSPEGDRIAMFSGNFNTPLTIKILTLEGEVLGKIPFPAVYRMKDPKNIGSARLYFVWQSSNQLVAEGWNDQKPSLYQVNIDDETVQLWMEDAWDPVVISDDELLVRTGFEQNRHNGTFKIVKKNGSEISESFQLPNFPGERGYTSEQPLYMLNRQLYYTDGKQIYSYDLDTQELTMTLFDESVKILGVVGGKLIVNTMGSQDTFQNYNLESEQ